MATITRDGDEVVVKLTAFEKIEGVHGDMRFPLADVSSVEVIDDALGHVKGLWNEMKLAGAYIPGVTAVGSFMGGEEGGLTLAVVHHDTPRGLQILLSDGRYRRVVLGLPDPDVQKRAVFG